MRCPKCGYHSFDHQLHCPRCGRDLSSVRRALNLDMPALGPASLMAIERPLPEETDFARALDEFMPVQATPEPELNTLPEAAEEPEPDLIPVQATPEPEPSPLAEPVEESEANAEEPEAPELTPRPSSSPLHSQAGAWLSQITAALSATGDLAPEPKSPSSPPPPLARPLRPVFTATQDDEAALLALKVDINLDHLNLDKLQGEEL